jgi:hypothetical protein
MLAEAGDLSEYERELARRRTAAALAEAGRWVARVLDELGRAVRAAARALGELFRQLRPAWRRAVAVARWVTEARRARLRALHVDYRRRRESGGEAPPSRERPAPTGPVRDPAPVHDGVAKLATRYLLDGYRPDEVAERLGVDRGWYRGIAHRLSGGGD